MNLYILWFSSEQYFNSEWYFYVHLFLNREWVIPLVCEQLFHSEILLQRRFHSRRSRCRAVARSCGVFRTGMTDFGPGFWFEWLTSREDTWARQRSCWASIVKPWFEETEQRGLTVPVQLWLSGCGGRAAGGGGEGWGRHVQASYRRLACCCPHSVPQALWDSDPSLLLRCFAPLDVLEREEHWEGAHCFVLELTFKNTVVGGPWLWTSVRGVFLRLTKWDVTGKGFALDVKEEKHTSMELNICVIKGLFIKIICRLFS